jgi:hypothetical protein
MCEHDGNTTAADLGPGLELAAGTPSLSRIGEASGEPGLLQS